MYASSTYGFAPGANNTPPQMPGYNLDMNGAPPNAQTPGPTPQHHGPQQQQQQQQHMMYNPQQYPGGHQSPYGGPAGVPMAQSPGLMQQQQHNSNGMAQMAGNNGIVTAQPYQTPYSSSPYGPGMPNSSSGAPQQSYMTPTANASAFNMNSSNMTSHQQRMQPPSSASITSSQRGSPYGGAPHISPPHTQQQSQFMTPQNLNLSQQQQVQLPSQLQTQQPPNSQPQSAGTPQTPNFPPSSANTNQAVATPLSPGSESREKDRVSLLLDINRELLMEVMRLQEVQAAAKKESSALKEEDKDKAGVNGEEKKDKPMAATGKEYVECMRRLQCNLAYLAAIADRSHKPSSQIPPHPAIISAPPLTPLKPGPKTASTASPKTELGSASNPASPSKPIKAENTTDGMDGKDLMGDHKEPRVDRLDTLRDQYKRLQALFPGVDPKKEPPLQAAKGAAKGAPGQKPPGQTPQSASGNQQVSR